MSVISEIGKQLAKEIMDNVRQIVSDNLGYLREELLARIPTVEEGTARVLGNPKFKAYLAKLPAEAQAVIKAGVPAVVAAVLETIHKVLGK